MSCPCSIKNCQAVSSDISAPAACTWSIRPGLMASAAAGAGESHHRVDLVSGREGAHVSSDVLDNAGDIGSENQGEVYLWPPLGREHLHALAQVPVGRIESDSMDSHDDLAWAGNGLRCIFVSQNIRATELVQPDRFHLLVSFRPERAKKRPDLRGRALHSYRFTSTRGKVTLSNFAVRETPSGD